MNARNRSIYLDYAATTPVEPQVAEAMLRVMGSDGMFANAASGHPAGGAAAAAVAHAHVQVAALIGAEPEEIIWTSGATESINLAIKGVAEFYRDRGRHIVTVKTEHKATLDACAALARQGFDVDFLTPDRQGCVAPETIAAALRDDTLLVSVMHVNNEIGVLQNVPAIAEICRERGIAFHVDATQSVGRVPVALAQWPIDLMSFSAHKLYGPKGAGALFVRRRPRIRLRAQIHGGGHQSGLRAGTLATHQIVGMGEACQLAGERMGTDAAHMERLSERLRAGLVPVPGVIYNGHPTRRVPGIVNISFEGVDGEALLAELTLPRTPEDVTLALSSGSACTAENGESSYVLRALGHNDALAAASLRISPGRHTTLAEMDTAIERIRSVVTRLRALSPLWPAGGQTLPRPETNSAL